VNDLGRTLECLDTAGINIVPFAGASTHFVLESDGFILLVERTDDGFGNIGAPGLLTEHGFAALIWRGDESFFVAKNFEQPATEKQVEAARKFLQIVKNCIQH